jgi:hypothetical protein
MIKANSKGLAALTSDLQVSKKRGEYGSKRKENPLRSEKRGSDLNYLKADLPYM